jgi:hypothetical protein
VADLNCCAKDLSTFSSSPSKGKSLFPHSHTSPYSFTAACVLLLKRRPRAQGTDTGGIKRLIHQDRLVFVGVNMDCLQAF